MASECAHCTRPIGCGCQQAVSSTKKPVHKTCLADYEASVIAGTNKK
jgi:hypothetical protein|tara:strand:+ start:1057 stop:1197 length:141 start_codon:yes stop_codon:yes gene_type:complete